MIEVNKDNIEVPSTVTTDILISQVNTVMNPGDNIDRETITIAPKDIFVDDKHNLMKELEEVLDIENSEFIQEADNPNDPEDAISFSINKATAGAALVGALVGCLFGPVASILLASAAAYATTVSTRILVGNASRKIGSAAYDKITSIRSNKASAGAAIGGGLAGCLCGPVGMILGASLAVYVSTRDDRVGEISRTAGSNIYDKISSWKNSIDQNLKNI